jgi:hypothetical protein
MTKNNYFQWFVIVGFATLLPTSEVALGGMFLMTFLLIKYVFAKEK